MKNRHCTKKGPGRRPAHRVPLGWINDQLVRVSRRYDGIVGTAQFGAAGSKRATQARDGVLTIRN
jgi:hypothetical protein